MLYLKVRRGPAVIGVLCLLAAGCVEGQVRDLVRYDRDSDSFRCLQAYTNLHAKDKSDLDHLAKLWEKRASILTNPAQLHLFTTTAYERRGKHKFCALSLGEPANREPEVKTTRADLDTIQVMPGEFYLGKHKTLSYYHQIVIPGKTVDAILEEASPLLAEQIAAKANEQLQLLEKQTGKRLTWDEVRKRALTAFTKGGAAPPGEGKAKGDEEVLPLEAASLRLLIRAGADRSLKLSRKQEVFRFVLPLSPRDTQEALATFDLIKETITDRHKKGQPAEPGLPDVVASFRLGKREGNGLEVSVDLPGLIVAAQAGREDALPDAQKTPGYKNTIKGIEDRGIKVNKMLSLDELVAKYKAR
jgi:hypothetical protein